MKGKIEEIFSKARFADDIGLYSVAYRDLDIEREISLQAFLDTQGTDEPIPPHRIRQIKRASEIVYSRANTGVLNDD